MGAIPPRPVKPDSGVQPGHDGAPSRRAPVKPPPPAPLPIARCRVKLTPTAGATPAGNPGAPALLRCPAPRRVAPHFPLRRPKPNMTTPQNPSATPQGDADAARPDFLQMDNPQASDTDTDANAGADAWYGWPHHKIEPVTLLRPDGKTERVRTPVMELEGLITPTELHYVVQHFGVPDPVAAPNWTLSVDGEIKKPLRLSYAEVRRFPSRSVRTVMECSGSDATYFEYFKGEGPRPSRTQERMILSGSEWTGVPLAAILNAAGLTGRATHVRAEGWDEGVPATAAPGTEPFFYDKGLPLQKALHPDTILAYAQNGQLLEHLHGSPIRLLVPGWSGNWSVKWLRRLEILDHEPDCWYHYNFYYYGDSPDDPNKELIHHHRRQILGDAAQRRYRRSARRPPCSARLRLERQRRHRPGRRQRGRRPNLASGPPWRNRAERWMWRRWSWVWDAVPGHYTVMSRATDSVGNVQSHEPRYNNMRKNFSAIVGYDITVE